MTAASTLPTFLIAGERRCGTTWLYHWLRQHPEIWLYPKADMDYFIEEETRGRVWRPGPADASRWESTHSVEEYADMFANGSEFAARGQKDADLLYWRPAHDRLARYLPGAKFVIMLRDPVARAWSHYWNEIGKGRETLSFPAAIEAEPSRSAESAYAHHHLSYVSRGFYDESLRDLCGVLGRDRVHVVILEEARADPAAASVSISRFLGVDTTPLPPPPARERNANVALVPRRFATSTPARRLEKGISRAVAGAARLTRASAETRRGAIDRSQRLFRRAPTSTEMPDGTRAHLAEVYAPHVDRLADLLGRRPAGWQV